MNNSFKLVQLIILASPACTDTISRTEATAVHRPPLTHPALRLSSFQMLQNHHEHSIDYSAGKGTFCPNFQLTMWHLCFTQSFPTTLIKFVVKRKEIRTDNSYNQNSRTRIIFQFLILHLPALRRLELSLSVRFLEGADGCRLPTKNHVTGDISLH